MTESEMITAIRAHTEAQFPRACPTCGHHFRDLEAWVRGTESVGEPRSFDADFGHWRPLSPIGTQVLVNCACGSSLALDTRGLPLLTLWGTMAWARDRAELEGTTLGAVLQELRERIRAMVLEDSEGASESGIAPRGDLTGG